jgi:3-oxoacyl-[acyl-carrier-protein] synthase II
MLVLEDMDRAVARGATIHAEIVGYAANSDGYDMVAPSGEGAARCMRLAMKGAGNRRIDYLNPHGTGTPANDRTEVQGIVRAFGERAGKIPVTSIKSMVGHCLGAAGGVEAAALALTIDRGVIPPTINHTQTDPDCAAADIVANTARCQPVRCAISTSLAFGGNDAAVVMKRVC